MAVIKTIDPIYKTFTKKVLKTISSTEFYDYFMETMLAGKNVFQFTNRKVEKYVDERWVNEIEKTIRPIEEIISNPRNFIIQEEVIVNVALAKKVTPDSIRHLASHGNMIDKFEEGNVRPNKLMEKYKEDSWDTYENKFVYTLIDMAYDFVAKRYDAIFNAMQGEYGAHMIMDTEAKNYQEKITSHIDLRIQQDDDILLEDQKNESIFARIARLHRILGTFKSTLFYKEMQKFGKIKPPLVPTNAIKKNPNFKACHKLWNFILAYNDIGYKIEIYEQNPEIDDDFAIDMYHTIMMDYIVLKHHLEDKKDREIDTSKPFRKKTLKPRYIKEIVEEIVKNYDLPDVEIRKVLIEEITKAQLMKEAEEERMRLVEEKEKEMKAKRLAEEKERKRKEKEEERARIQAEKIRLKELERQEKERAKELERQKKEEERIAQEETERIYRFKNEFEAMFTDILAREEEREKAKQKEIKAQKDKEKAEKAKVLKEKKKKEQKEAKKQQKGKTSKAKTKTTAKKSAKPKTKKKVAEVAVEEKVPVMDLKEEAEVKEEVLVQNKEDILEVIDAIVKPQEEVKVLENSDEAETLESKEETAVQNEAADQKEEVKPETKENGLLNFFFKRKK